jgi:hypothetical protein
MGDRAAFCLPRCFLLMRPPTKRFTIWRCASQSPPDVVSLEPHQGQPAGLPPGHQLFDDVGGQQRQAQQLVAHRVVQSIFGPGDVDHALDRTGVQQVLPVDGPCHGLDAASRRGRGLVGVDQQAPPSRNVRGTKVSSVLVHQASTSTSSAPMPLGANSPISASQPSSRHFTLMPCTSPTWTRSMRSIIRLAMRWRSTGNN